MNACRSDPEVSGSVSLGRRTCESEYVPLTGRPTASHPSGDVLQSQIAHRHRLMEPQEAFQKRGDFLERLTRHGELGLDVACRWPRSAWGAEMCATSVRNTPFHRGDKPFVDWQAVCRLEGGGRTGFATIRLQTYPPVR